MSLERSPSVVSSEHAELCQRAVEGDMAATGRLLKALAPGMVRVARALMGTTHADVDDVVQQSLVAFIQALPAFRGQCTPAQYAHSIVARIAVGTRHRAQLRGERNDTSYALAAVPSDAPSAPEQLTAERRRMLVRGLLDRLPHAQAETLGLRVALGFSLGEVAAATGVPLNTVRSRIRLAKEALRRRIESDPKLQLMLEVESC